MFFGGSSFASSPFADPGGVSIAFTVNGVRMNVAIGNVVIQGKSIVLPDGQRVDLATGDVTIRIGQTVIPVGNQFNLASGDPFVITWNQINPGATGVWIPIDPDNP